MVHIAAHAKEVPRLPRHRVAVRAPAPTVRPNCWLPGNKLHQSAAMVHRITRAVRMQRVGVTKWSSGRLGRRCAPRRHPAVDHEIGTGDVGRILTQQKGDSGGDFLG